MTEQSQSQSTTLILPIIKSWLSNNHTKIQNFWIGADWRAWARFDLFTAIETTLTKTHLVTHSNDGFYPKPSKQLIDVVIEPRSSTSGQIGLVLRCERVNENAGSFEDFVKEYERDWTELMGLGKPDPGFEGAMVMLVGFSGEPRGDDEDEEEEGGQFKDPEPQGFSKGEVYVWIRELTYPSDSN